MRFCQIWDLSVGTSLEWQPSTATAAEVSPHPANTTSPVKVRQTHAAHIVFYERLKVSDDASACCHKLAVNFDILSWDTEQNTDPCTHFLSFYERYYTSRRRSQKARMFSLPLPFCSLSVVHKVKNCQAVYKTQAGNRSVHKCAHMHAFTQRVSWFDARVKSLM